MEPTAIGARLASAAIAPLVRKLFVTEGPGAGLVDRPIRISGYVSFKGEKRTLTASDVRALAAELVKQALRAGEHPIRADEQQAVTDALADTLQALGELTISDLDAVRLGHQAFARDLRRVSDSPERHLSADGAYFYEALLDTACLHILHFFTQRSTFVAHTLVQQTRAVDELILKVDELMRRSTLPGGEEAAFEQAYLAHITKKHGKLTIYGIDLNNSPARWPLDVAYLSLEASPLSWPWQSAAWQRTLRHGAPGGDSVSHHLLSSSVDPQAPLSAEAGSLPSCDTREQMEDTRKRLLLAADERPESSRRHSSEGDRLNSLVLREMTADRLIRESLSSQPADQALATDRRILLRGEAGSGKTTLIQWLAVSTARQDLPDRMEYLYDRVPFVLPLRTLTRHGERLPAPKDFLAATGCPLAGTQPAGWEHRVLVAGRGLILIDGIDEIPDRERERTRRWLQDLIETYDGDNRWLVTSRPSAVDQGWLAEDGFTGLTLSAMGPDDTAAFIERWHDAARIGVDDAADLDRLEAQLLTAVRTEPDLGRLAVNPLMCGLICALHRDRRGYLPHGRKDLYEAALSMLLTRRDRERDMMGPDLADGPQLDVLQRLAYWLVKNGRTEMDRSRATDIIGRALPAVPEVADLGDAATVFEYFLQRSGLLREPAPDTVDFIHRTFQDFLGARAALEEGDFGLLVAHAADDQWSDVIRMAVALARAGERVTVFRGLLELGDRTEDKRLQARIYLLAAACLGHATSLDPAVRHEVEQRTATLIPPGDEEEARALAEVGPLILNLLPGPDEVGDVTAFHVVIAATHIKSDAAVAFLARFVEHPFLPVRSQLSWAWSRFDTRQYAEEVIARLDPANLNYAIRSDDQLHQLNRLGLEPERLDVRAGVSLEALDSYVSRHRLAFLMLSNDAAADLGFLVGHTELRSLVIGACPALVDVTALSGLSIRHLDIASARSDMDLHPLSQLGDLETLMVSGPSGLEWSPQDLPVQAPLSSLSVSGEARPRRGLEGLGDLTQLTSLTLNRPSSPASTDDWEQICGLSRLTDLSTTAASFETLPATALLSSVSGLSLIGGGGERVVQAAVNRLANAFPGLIFCEFTGDMTAEGDVDLSSLAELAHLQSFSLAIDRDRVRGIDTLPSWVDLHLL
ncbi:NACHT domain-containing protein [Streptomyces sp. NPDC002922]|uniref:NACHT domain-containing protein n=1 Tax=Streptomyces sp. NPDC002922 TaxID=3154439 RepID=UPI0033BF1C9A